MGRRPTLLRNLLRQMWVGMDSAHAIRHGAALSPQAHRHIAINRSRPTLPPRDPLGGSSGSTS